MKIFAPKIERNMEKRDLYVTIALFIVVAQCRALRGRYRQYSYFFQYQGFALRRKINKQRYIV